MGMNRRGRSIPVLIQINAASASAWLAADRLEIEEDAMNAKLLAIATAAALVFSAPAFAQSQEGGYLGVKLPQAPELAATTPGGYLGKGAGRDLKPMPRSVVTDVKASPTAWCVDSIEPRRCAGGKAVFEHAYCLERNPEHYESCRRALDFMQYGH